MSKVVEFLEKLGSEPNWRFASTDDIEQAMVKLDIEPSMRSAILAKDASGVQTLLGQTKLIGMLTPSPNPLPQEPEPEEEEEGEEGTDAGSKNALASSSPSATTRSLS